MSDTVIQNLINISNPDVPIYRTFPLWRFREALRTQSMGLVAPRMWEDPFENFLVYCGITYMENGAWKQDFFDRVRKPVYAQCWSLAAESDALWRIYSKVDKDHVTGRNKVADSEGLKVKTTARKLLQTLWDSSPIRPDDSCFLGQVDYLEQNVAVQRVANEVRGARLDAFSGGLGHAQSLLIKRPSFDHEREIRLIFVEHREDHDKASVLPIRIDPNALFEEIILDPRLHADDVLERSAELKALGYTGPVNKSDLYQGTFHQIVLT